MEARGAGAAQIVAAVICLTSHTPFIDMSYTLNCVHTCTGMYSELDRLYYSYGCNSTGSFSTAGSTARSACAAHLDPIFDVTSHVHTREYLILVSRVYLYYCPVRGLDLEAGDGRGEVGSYGTLELRSNDYL